MRQLHFLGLICQPEAAATKPEFERKRADVLEKVSVFERDKENDRGMEGRQSLSLLLD